MRAVKAIAVVLSLLSSAHAYAQGTVPAACNGRQVTFDCRNGACELVIEIVGKPGCRLRIDDAWLKTLQKPRITEGTSLAIKVVGANLLRYALKFETKEKVVESYVDLEKLWKQVLTLVPDTLGRTGVAGDFATAIKEWRKELLERDSQLTAFVARFKGLTLACGERDAIRAETANTKGWLEKLEELRKKAADAAADSDDFPVYDSTLAAHDAIVNRIKTFETRGAVAADGFPKRITFGDAGRIVTVSITMTDLAGGTDAGVAEVVEFFVHSSLPVTFHAGYSYTSLDSFEFEPVASLAGEDLFAQINEGKNTSGFTAFLSYRLGRADRAPGGQELFLTLGTDFKDPGKTLFIGGTTRVKRILLSGGIATAALREAKEGDRVTDIIGGIAGALGTRELFTRIQTTRQWRPFFAVTFAPF